MKKKLIFVSLVVIFVVIGLMVAGCAKVEGNNNVKNVEKDKVVVEVNNKTFELHSDETLKNLHYKENYVDFHTDAIGKIRIMSYEENGKYVFEIRLAYEEEHSFSEVKALYTYPEQHKNINGIDYYYYEYTNSNNDNIHAYLYEYNNVTYTIIFLFNDNIDSLEQTFMSKIYYE